MSIRANLRDGSYEWLVAILLSWWIPFQLFGEFDVRYWVSLVLWALPVALLFPRVLRNTHRGSRRRQALLAAAAYVFVAGVVLDFLFGAVILNFDKCPPGLAYLRCLAAVGGKIPIEEYLFYIFGALAVVLIYVWADMHWLAYYNVRQRQGLIPAPGHLIELSPSVALTGAAMLAAGIAWKLYYVKSPNHWWNAIPYYYTFLVVFAFLPLILMYRGVKGFVNWRAFSLTGLYVLLTAAVWEVTLALPECWWCYKDDAMIGKIVPAWSRVKNYPIEALLVWIAVVFVAVFFYEFWEAYYYDNRPPVVKLFTGGFPPPVGGPPPPPPPSPLLSPARGVSVIMRGTHDSDERLRRLQTELPDGRLDDGRLEVVVVAPQTIEIHDLRETVGRVAVDAGDYDSWRAVGAASTSHPTLCFVDASLTAAPRVFRLIRDVLESPRIVGGSTSTTVVVPVHTSLLHNLRSLPKAWILGLDRGVTFCRRVDFDALPIEVQRADQEGFLRGLRALGKATKRVLTRLPTDGVLKQIRRP